MKRILFVMSLLVVGACYSEEPAPGYAYAGGGDGYGAPGMEVVAPGVQVVSDYDYPVFYSDGFYWRYDNNMWYRSGYYNRGWAVSYNVPVGVRGIARPEAYAHYRGGFNGGYRGGVGVGARGGYRGGGEVRGTVRSSGGVRSAPSRGTSHSSGGHHR